MHFLWKELWMSKILWKKSMKVISIFLAVPKWIAWKMGRVILKWYIFLFFYISHQLEDFFLQISLQNPKTGCICFGWWRFIMNQSQCKSIHSITFSLFTNWMFHWSSKQRCFFFKNLPKFTRLLWPILIIKLSPQLWKPFIGWTKMFSSLQMCVLNFVLEHILIRGKDMQMQKKLSTFAEPIKFKLEWMLPICGQQLLQISERLLSQCICDWLK